MQYHEKIKLFRHLKGWSQEDVAEQLAMSVGGYGAIERGATDVQLSRLKQIAGLFGIELAELFGSEKSTISTNNGHAIGDNFGYQYQPQQSHHWHIHANDEIAELKHQLEIAELKNKESEKDLGYLKQLLELMDKKDKI